jgi:DNA-directed RNA polymerase subunit RPC12/RpoP
VKYVCDRCGAQLAVDRDLDDDRTFERAREMHLRRECPGDFVEPEARKA